MADQDDGLTATTSDVTSWERVSLEELTAEQQTQHERARAAVRAMGGRLLGELEAALDKGGPVEAIGVCQSRAPVIAREIAAEQGVRIGRTAERLRNPDNTPPHWAQQLIAVVSDEPVALASSNGDLGVLLPIHLKGPCTMCHGQREEIAEEVQKAIAEHYPDDAATGFAEGDLRGWFWVEVPSGPSPDQGMSS